MNALKKYIKNHLDATIQDYNNQKHKMQVLQASRTVRGKHTGSKSKKQLLNILKYV